MFSDTNNQRIVKVSITSGISTEWLGNGVDGWQSTTGVVASASQFYKNFNYPQGLSYYSPSLYISDTLNHRIIKIEN